MAQPDQAEQELAPGSGEKCLSLDPAGQKVPTALSVTPSDTGDTALGLTMVTQHCGNAEINSPHALFTAHLHHAAVLLLNLN